MEVEELLGGKMEVEGLSGGKMEVEELSGGKVEVEGVVQQLLSGDWQEVLKGRRKDLPELLHRAGSKSIDGGREDKWRLLVLASRVIRVNPGLGTHLSQWLVQCGPPWQEEELGERSIKRPKLDQEVPREVLAAAHHLLLHMPRLQQAWSWTGLFTLLPAPCLHTRFLVIEILRQLFRLPEAQVRGFRLTILGPDSSPLVADLCVEYEVKEYLDLGQLAEDSEQLPALEMDLTGVARIEHLSLLRETQGNNGDVLNSELVEVNSTLDNLVQVAGAVAVGQPVLLVGEAGVGKTSLVRELARRTGKELLTLQVSDNTDSRLLVGLYRCTELPGQFVWEPGLLTRALTRGAWLLIEDAERAQHDVLALLEPLTRGGGIIVPSLGGLVMPEPGFQLFLTQRMGEGCAKEELSKLARSVKVKPLADLELREVVSKRFPSLANLTEKILRMFSILTQPHQIQSMGASEQARLVNCLRQSRKVTVRDVLRWCARGEQVANSVEVSQLSSLLYQDAVDCFCRFVPLKEVRVKLSQEIAFTMNISKDDAEYLTTKHKPSLSQTDSGLQIGRVHLPFAATTLGRPPLHSVFSLTKHTAVLLEAATVALVHNEPLLLVGETGVGKTTSVQFLAEKTGRKLRVVNLNQQSDSADLLGGFRPVSLAHSLHGLRQKFTAAFCSTFNPMENAKFLAHLDTCFQAQRWEDALQLIRHSIKAAVKRIAPEDNALASKWENVKADLKLARQMVLRTELATVFGFVEGALTEAVKQGDWILLDEVNMAAPETLECLSSLLEPKGSITLIEAGQHKAVPRHPEFRLLACMNPATDTGKCDLPAGIRNRFTEVVVDEMTDTQDIRMLVQDYLQGLALPAKQISGIVQFYSAVRTAASTSLVTGEGRRPTFSLRTLCRALKVAARNPCGSVRRSLLEAFSLAFLTEVDSSSHPVIMELIGKHVIGTKEAARLVKQPILQQQPNSIQVEGFWISRGTEDPINQESYIITDQVRRNLADLSRIVSLCDHPVLLQGDTSVGKTSLITYLAQLTGNKCVRVNNHEHTDIQEYLGSYTSDSQGKLVFKLGVLAEAMLNGSWIILDELNLAPTDVLEALNRVLDDNRELFIPETQETIAAQPGFRLFGTQNPAGQYGGRKVLSRAFRNRFLELHFDQLPPPELETILERRCALPKSYATKCVSVLGELQRFRRSSAAFAGREGFITLRDLFRWAERYRQAGDVKGFHDWDQHLAEEGYLVVAARVRNPEEEKVIREILAKVFKRTVDPDKLFTLSEHTSFITRPILEFLQSPATASKYPALAWTWDMRRLAVLVQHAWSFKEPVLLVGETGCGKTTVVQVLSALADLNLICLNCHSNTESGDFLGSLRPDRKGEKLFAWADGPLVTAMRNGAVFLADEISLAEDSVLERMNSVLEPERRILLAECAGTAGTDTEVVTAVDSFHFVATMNPGGDYGKKELSPALKNRFSEIWCPGVSGEEDLRAIVSRSLGVDLQELANPIVSFAGWLKQTTGLTVSVRDMLAWVVFINTVVKERGLPQEVALVQGAHLVWLDGLQLEGAAGISKGLIEKCHEVIGRLSNAPVVNHVPVQYLETKDHVSVHPFSIARLGVVEGSEPYSFMAETTSVNVGKILRALQILKPILLEGSPGIGKTSLVTALAARVGVPIVRINLSDQTDVSDLFGCDLPVEGGAAGEFSWRNGPFLEGMQQGHWILLDELNLASQSVLEGLNAVFDHRGEAYIPELDKRFPLHPQTRVFACQNPLGEGGDRKGLPKSFLNRFSKVYMGGLSACDLSLICNSLHPALGDEVVQRMVSFNCRLEKEVVKERRWGQQGAPWEFNLRDLLRWCKAMESEGSNAPVVPGRYVRLIYEAKMRRKEDKERVVKIYKEIFEPDFPLKDCEGGLLLTESHVTLGEFQLPRGKHCTNLSSLDILPSQTPALEVIAGCVKQGWPVVLTGEAGSGKSTMVQILAALCSKPLAVLSITHATDTMELLGGFEQVDLDRSVGELRQRVVTWARQAAVSLLDRNTTSGLLLMQALLQLEGEAGKGKAEEILESLRRLVKRVEETGMCDQACKTKNNEVESMARELKDANKQGTFEWLDSVLVEAVREGKWLVIDNANFCSASVLDRLNCLFESGGLLTLSERGVLGGEIPKVVPHPDFRAFLLYDPSKGEVSRAMRNRGVEVHLEKNLVDPRQLLLNRLGPAAASEAAMSAAEKVLASEESLQSKLIQLSVLAQDTLCGGELEIAKREPDGLSPLERLLWALPDNKLAVRESALWHCLYQMRPLLSLLKEGNGAGEHGLLNYLRFATSKDLSFRQQLLSKIGSRSHLPLCAALEHRLEDLAWDWRLLPPGSQMTAKSPTQSNITDLLLSIEWLGSRFSENLNSSPGSIMARGDSVSAEAGMDSPVLHHLPRMLATTITLLKTQMASCPDLPDPLWSSLDASLSWFQRLMEFSLLPLTRDSAELLARGVTVHWRWLVKRLLPHLQAAGCTELIEVLTSFDKIVRSHPAYCSRSCSRLRRQLGAAPPPPTSQLESNALATFTKLDKNPLLAQPLHRARFQCISGTKVASIFSQLDDTGPPALAEAAKSLVDLQESYKALVEEGVEVKVSVEAFLHLQTSAVQEELAILEGCQPDQATLQLRHQVLLKRGGNKQLLTAMETSHRATRPALKLAISLQHDPVRQVLAPVVEAVKGNSGILPLLTHFVTLREGGGGTAISCLEEKTEQLEQILQLLKAANCSKRDPDTEQLWAELEEMMVALVSTMRLAPSYPGFLPALDLLSSHEEMSSLLPIFKYLRQEKEEGPREQSPLSAHKLNICLSCLRLQLFSQLGAMDPAEKAALKHKYAGESVLFTRDRLRAREVFSEHLGGRNHPHTDLLRTRLSDLEQEEKRRSGLRAVRGDGADFPGLSSSVRHFATTLGSPASLLAMVDQLEDVIENSDQESPVPTEAKVWCRSALTFLSGLLSHSSYPDLVSPVAEATAQLISILTSAVEKVDNSLERALWPNLEQSVQWLASFEPPTDATIGAYAAWLMDCQATSLLWSTLASSSLLDLRSSILTLAQSQRPNPAILKILVDKILEVWRREEAAREEKKALEDSMYRMKTHDDEEGEEELEKKEYAKLFPTFAELFSDLVQDDHFGERREVAKEASEVVAKDNSALCELVGLLQRLLLNKETSLEQKKELAQERERNFLARFGLVSSLLSNSPRMMSPHLQQSLLAPAISFVSAVRRQNMQETGTDFNFYRDSNAQEVMLVRPLVTALATRVLVLLEQFPENPVLEQILKVKARVVSISVGAPIPQFLTGLELLLSSSHEWQKNAHRGVSLQVELEPITKLVLRWRQLELSGWKLMLGGALERLREKAADYWLHLCSVALERSSSKEEVVRSLIKFIEASTLADFHPRLQMLESVGRMLEVTSRGRLTIRAAIANLVTYYTGLMPGVEKALAEKLRTAEGKVKEFTKLARWKDTSFWSVKAVVDKSRKMLHKTMREYQKAVSLPAKPCFVEAQLEDEVESDEGGSNGLDIPKLSSSQQLVDSDVSVRSMTGKDCGSLSHLLRRATRLSRGLTTKLSSSQLVGEVKDLLPFLVAEMEKLRGLAPDLKRSKEEQKKQAGFIQQRKRAGLNDLFKTLQSLGFSYRFRQLVPLLDRALPADVSSVLGERFLGFAQHLLFLATGWRENIAGAFQRLQDIRDALEPLGKEKVWDLSRSGAEYHDLISKAFDTIESCGVTLEARVQEWPEVQELQAVLGKVEDLKKVLATEVSRPLTAFPESGARAKVTSWSGQVVDCASLLSSISISSTALNPSLQLLQSQLSSLAGSLDNWLMRCPSNKSLVDGNSFRSLLDKLIVKSLLGIQQVQKTSSSLPEEEKAWTETMEDMMVMGSNLKTGPVKMHLRRVEAVLTNIAGLREATDMLKEAQDAALVVSQLSHVAEAVQELSVEALLNFTKLVSVILKVFSEIAVHGFCPVKDMDDEGASKSSDEFKSSEEETGLGQGEGAKDVSDQIENEDMLDGAYQNPEDGQDKEEKDNKEEDNGIEMSENFDSNLQDKNEEEKGDEEEEDKEGELEDESGEVEGNEDLDKDMWGEEEEEKEDKSELEESEEKGKAEEEHMDELAAKEDNEKTDKSDEKRQRKEEEKEKENEPQEFDDNQTDTEHSKDQNMEEPEAFDLPENMDLDDKEAEDNFEEAAANEPEKMPDFEDEVEDEEEGEDDEGKDEKGKTEIENMAEEEEEEKMEDVVSKDTEEDMDQDEQSENDSKEEESRHEEAQSGMDIDEENDDQQALEQKSDLDQDKKSKGDEGMNDESRQNTEDKKSFGVKGNEDEKEEEPKKQEAGSGTESQEERSLAENMSNSEIERLEVVEGSATGEEGKQSASVFRHVMDEKEEDKSALDKMKDQEDVKEQVLPKDWDMKKPEEREEKVTQKKEEEREKDKKKSSKGGENNMEEEEEREEKEEEGSDAEFTRTYDVARGAESLAVRREMDEVVVNRGLEELPDSISLQPITLTDQEGEEGSQGVAQLSHQLCEQLRLILEPTKAAKLQGDFRTGKRLNMRKIIPYIASQFKKDKIWLRRVKPNKREFQIAVALDDSSSMADNKSRTLALQALATISSALSLLEAGQLGVIRFGAKAEIVHGLDQQWGAQAGRRVEGQFGFEQKETSVVSLLNLATALFTSRRGQAARGLAVSQLLVIVSDGRGIFHEGKEKVSQAVMRARQAGYFCLFLIVENPENKDSVLDIRLPVFKDGQLASIDSYMEHFPFQHYIVLRDVETLPHTLSDSLRQWFELVTS